MKKILHLFFLFFIVNSFAQANLVQDINLGNSSSNPGEKIFFKNEIYFPADDGIHGTELWKTDGTETGTILVKDIYTGLETGIKSFKALATTDFLYFFAIEDGQQYLFRTDGTAAGTEKIKDFSTVGSIYAELNNEIILSAQNALWKTDGTEAGTTQISSISPSGENFAILNNQIFYGARANSFQGTELWVTDGTQAGTKMVKDIYAGSNKSSFPNFFKVLNDQIYFIASNGTNGFELWKTDGTPEETQLVSDVTSGSSSTSFNNIGLTVFNQKIYFTNNTELWVSEGTDATTFLVKDLEESIIAIQVINNQIIAFNRKNTFWTSDGTTNNTIKNEIDIFEFFHNNTYQKVGDVIYFQGYNELGYELWKTDGTVAGTVLVKDILPVNDDNNLEDMIAFGDKLIFTGKDGNYLGTELYISDGTETGTFMLKDINTTGNRGSFVKNLFEFNDKVLFSADNGFQGAELWVFDGTNTVLLKDINEGIYYSNPSNFVEVNGIVYFKATTQNTGTELWKTDGTASGTVLVKDINAGFNAGLNFGNLTVVENEVFFFASDGTTGFELWKSDGTETGTVLIKDMNPGDGNSYRDGQIITYKNKVYFTAHAGDNDFEVWESDGTEAGTKIHHHYNFSGSSNPRLYTIFNDFLYYSAKDDLIKSDGTTATVVSNIDPSNLTVAGDKLFFTAGFSDGGELWVTNGNTTNLVKDIRNGSSGSFPSKLTAHKNNIFFIADDGINGTELWVSDGTNSGTTLVKDIRTGSRNASLTELVSFGDKVLFGGGEFNSANELWVTDGTEEGTVLFQEINPSIEQYNSGSNPQNFFVFNDTLLFSADDGTLGNELFMLQENALSVTNNQSNLLSKVTIYPNPTSSILNIKVDDQEINEVKIYNLLGKEVVKVPSKLEEIKSIDIAELLKGIYVIQIKTNSNTFTKKIIKN